MGEAVTDCSVTGLRGERFMQARAEATRQKIIDSAVALFNELGYGETGLADVLERAGVSKGAFYYHFESKEALARAIIDLFDQRAAEAVAANFNPLAPTLEGVIRSTFAVQDHMRNETVVHIGQQLAQALGQICPSGAHVYRRWTRQFVEMVEMVINAGELRSDIEPTEAAEAIWVAVLGCHLVSAAVGDDPYARLGRSWRILLNSTLATSAVADANAVVDRVVADYQGALRR